MIPELGHYALVLALALGLIQSVVPVIGARSVRRGAHAPCELDCVDAVRFRRSFIFGFDHLLRNL